MKFRETCEDGRIHIFDVTDQVLIPSYCGKFDVHYKADINKPKPNTPFCRECKAIANREFRQLQKDIKKLRKILGK